MTNVEQDECHTPAVVVEDPQGLLVVEENEEEQVAQTTEPHEDKAEGTERTTTSADANTNDTLVDIFPHTVEDAEAELHTVKVISEEAEHEACMPRCLQAGSVSTPSPPNSAKVKELDGWVETADGSDVKESRHDIAELPTVLAVDEGGAQDTAIAMEHAEKSENINASGLSKETTEEGKAEVSSDSDTCPSDQEKPSGVNSSSDIRTFQVLAVPPQDLFFVVPPGCKPGQVVSVHGPHGPLQVQVPIGVKPGQRVAVRLAAPFQHRVHVPAGAKPGATVTFKGENGEQLQATVPPGKKPGQTFEVLPPVTMLRVPDDAKAGDRLQFKVPANPQAPAQERIFKDLTTTIPPDMVPGQYFAAMIGDETTEPEAHDQTEAEELVWV